MSTGLSFSKMSGAGNDFVVLEAGQLQGLAMPVERFARAVCRRGLSVGADGLLVVEGLGAGRVRVSFRNPDGSVAFCGNGSRCAARFAWRAGLAPRVMTLLTDAGELRAEILDDERVRLVLPAPQDEGRLAVDTPVGRLEGHRIRAGVPHFVVWVADVATAPLGLWGPVLRRHAAFGGEGTNVDLAGHADDGAIALRTWERGVEGETLACGSGAIAAAYSARLTGGGASSVVVPASGSRLVVDFPGDPAAPTNAVLVGDARMVLVGRLDPEALG